jgi:uncharacterized integral membrane protein (TIGR00698 family)
MTHSQRPSTLHRIQNSCAVAAVFRGVALCIAIAVAASVLQAFEARTLGRAWLEPLVIAIILGTIVRTAWTPSLPWRAGIAFSAKTLLEIAVVLPGATISAKMIVDAGPALLAGVVIVVCVSIAVSYGLGRLFGLPRRMATLIACGNSICGNSICGNSAIAAVAPVIGADGEDVAASIAFTAVLGVGVVLALPALAIAWRMTPQGFGVFAGLTVYAVPQVLAATAPISSFSAQVGTLVKLIRVLMLGPVLLALSLLARRDREERDAASGLAESVRPPLRHLAPWFIVGFLLALAARSAGIVPTVVLGPISEITTWLTIISMAALGLGVDIRVVARAGLRVSAVVTLSLVALGGLALLTIRAFGLG